MKKNIYFLLPILFLSFSLSAQITLTESYFPALGDTLFTATDNMPNNIDVQPGFGEYTWNFSGLQSPFSQQRIVLPLSEGVAAELFPGADFILEAANGIGAGEGYFRIQNGTYEMIGFAGEDPIGLNFNLATKFNPAYIERRAPLNFGDINQDESALIYAFSPDDLPVDLFADLPISPDSLRVRVAIEQLDVVDGWGTLIIPGGIFDVLREKRTETRETRLDAKIGFLGWQDITDITLGAIDNDAVTGQLGLDTTVIYSFFSNGEKEAIAVVNMDALGENITSVNYKAIDIVNSVQVAGKLKPNLYAHPNPTIVNVRFEFSNLPKDDYILSIYNIIGEKLWSKPYDINKNHIDKVNVSFLNKGTYLYSLANSKGRTLITKRLVIIRP